jgi:small subunit ribosomal protein S8
MFDPISDMLTRIRNAQQAGHKEVAIPFSKLKMLIAQILERENFVDLVKKMADGNHEKIVVSLKYDVTSNTRKIPAISGIERVSKVGQRIYIGKDEIEKVKNNYGISIVSTSRGVMTGNEARHQGLGGEYLCRIW